MEELQWGFPIATPLSLNKLHRLIGSKRKNKKKARGEHRRIYIRRSIKNGGLEGIGKRVGSRGKN